MRTSEVTCSTTTNVVGAPPPAGSAATEDGGQRYLEGRERSEFPGKYPAGLHPDPLPRRHAAGPSRGQGGNLDARLDVALTKGDRAAIDRRARRLGVKPSAWGRGALLDALDARRGEIERMHAVAVDAPVPELARAVDQLRRVGVNLNQALRRGDVVDDELLGTVLDAVTEVRASLGDRAVV